MIKRITLILLLSFNFCLLSSQIRIRLFTDESPSWVFFRVTSGQYIIDRYDGTPITVITDQLFVITRYKDKIIIKLWDTGSFQADSVIIRGSGTNSSFSLRTNSAMPSYRNYSGNLECYPDLGSLLLINTTGEEDYVAGVVKAEGGNGKNEEYFKTQAVIARTYTYKYLNKHIKDRFNLCDDTHCQVFNGLTGDSLINSAVNHTSNLVLVTSDSILIISAFHSNCGGETSPSEYVWLAPHSYLKKVADPNCITSKNAVWQKTLSVKEWYDMLSRNGYKGASVPAEAFAFRQRTRVQDYVTGTFAIPLRVIRDELALRSTWFSVTISGDSIILDGKGYGHGVGLCQEGAMVMAASGKKYDEIIKFYYPGARLVKIQDAKKADDDKKPVDHKPAN